MSTPTIEDILACQALPSLPGVALEVLELARDTEVDLRRIAQTLQNDPALAAKILRTVNSSYYALARPCPTILRALAYLGLNTVKALMLGFSLVDMTRGRDGFEFMSFWRRSLHGAAAARRLAALQRDCDPDEAFTAALLQDIGMLALEAAMPCDYGPLVQEAAADHESLPGIERRILGFDHAEVGGRLAEIWHLPPELCVAVGFHHAVDDDGQTTPLARIAAACAGLAVALDAENPFKAIGHLRDRMLRWFGVDAAGIQQLLEQTAGDAEQLRRLFKVSTGDAVGIQKVLTAAHEISVEQHVQIDRELEALRSANVELRDQALTDPLTRLSNRRHFDDQLVQRFDQANAFNGSLGLLLVDIDHFKKINDELGHQVGDVVLQQVARRLASSVRDRDLVARFGGEEFGVLVPGATVQEVAAIAERLRTTIATDPIAFEDAAGAAKSLNVAISVGATILNAESSETLTSPDILVRAADKALYAAKSAGRNCVRVFRARGNSALAG